MHVIIGIVITIATLVFWLGRAARGAEDIASAVNTVTNLPRKRRFQKHARKSGFDLVTTPTEAATILMITIARISEDRRVTSTAEKEIQSQLRGIGLSMSDADGIFRQMKSLMYDMVMPENSLFPMVKILQSSVDRSEAMDVADMMTEIAAINQKANTEQIQFIKRFRERMNLL